MTNPTKCCAECKYIGLPEAFGKPHAECPCHKQESWEVEFDELFDDPAAGDDLRNICKNFIRETLAKRDAFWESQEMGVSHDCKKHEEEAVAKERERVVGILEALPVGLSEEYIGNHSIVRCVDINRVIALITKEV